METTSVVKVKPSELAALLTAFIPARKRLLIVGMPGIGKSSLMEQACAAVNADLMISHAVTEDPTDSKGLPFPGNDGTAHWLPYGDLARAMAAKSALVWFHDDLGQATQAVQAAKMQVILTNRIGGHALPDCVTHMAATNRREDRAGVNGILEPVKSRFHAIVQLEPDVAELCEWMFGQGINPMVPAFLQFRPELMCQWDPKAGMAPQPNPRTWNHAAQLVGLGLPDGLERKAIAGAVGEGASVEFAAFCQLFRELCTAEQILLNPGSAAIPEQPDRLYATCAALVHNAAPGNMQAIVTYTARLPAMYSAFVMRSINKAKQECCKTEAFVRWICSPQGRTIMGGLVAGTQ